MLLYYIPKKLSVETPLSFQGHITAQQLNNRQQV
jgi:hypothetical protein